MRTFLALTLALIVSCGYSQEHTPSHVNRNSIQVGVFPAMYFNNLSLGFGIKRQRIEHVFEASSYLMLSPGRFAISTHYNCNYYLKKDKTFIPFWAGVSRINVDN